MNPGEYLMCTWRKFTFCSPCASFGSTYTFCSPCMSCSISIRYKWFIMMLHKFYFIVYLLCGCSTKNWKWNIEASTYYWRTFYFCHQFCQCLPHIFWSPVVWALCASNYYIFLGWIDLLINNILLCLLL